MFCRKCGKEVDASWTVCPNCGERLNSEVEQKSVVNEIHVKKEKKKKPFFKRIWFWVLVVIIVIIAATKSGGGDEAEKNTTKNDEVEKVESNENNEMDESSDTEIEDIDYTVLDIYKALEDYEVVPYVLNDKASQFLEEHEDCFPSTSYEQIAGLVDTSIEYKHIEKSADQYGDKLMELPELYVMSISEEDIGDGNKFTEIETTDANNHYFYILYNGQLDDIFKEDIIKADILPLGISSYDNVSGGTTITLVGAGSYIEKIE